MKRKAFALALVLALMLSAVAGIQLSHLAKANFLFPPGNPLITIKSPTDTTYNITTLALEVTFRTYKTAYEGGGVSRHFTYTLDGQNPENITIRNSRVDMNPGGDVFFWGEANLVNLTEGLHSLTVRVVFDYAPTPYYDGSTQYYGPYHTESEETVNFRIDIGSPKVVLLSLENKTYSTTDVPLNFTVSKPDTQVTYSLDGRENVTTVRNTTLTNLPSGEHNLTVYAEDTAGNVGFSETIRFNIEPFPTTLVIASVITVAVAGAGLTVYFKKRKR
jgi:hypothetical protein